MAASILSFLRGYISLLSISSRIREVYIFPILAESGKRTEVQRNSLPELGEYDERTKDDSSNRRDG